MCCTKNGLTYDGGKRRRGSRTGDCGEMTGTDLGDRARISWDLERRETLSLRAPCPRPRSSRASRIPSALAHPPVDLLEPDHVEERDPAHEAVVNVSFDSKYLRTRPRPGR